MTDILSTKEPVNRVFQVFREYQPDWSKQTMTTVNEMTSQFYVPKGLNELHSQFYGWLPDIPTPSVGHDWVVYGMLGIVIILLLRK